MIFDFELMVDKLQVDINCLRDKWHSRVKPCKMSLKLDISTTQIRATLKFIYPEYTSKPKNSIPLFRG